MSEVKSILIVVFGCNSVLEGTIVNTEGSMDGILCWQGFSICS